MEHRSALDDGCRLVAGCGLAVLLASGCGSDDSSSKASADTPMSELGAEDVGSVCDSYVDGTDYDAVCQYVAIGQTASDSGEQTIEELRTACAETRQRCVDSAGEAKAAARESCRTDWFTADCAASRQAVSDCLASMSENGSAIYAAAGTCESAELTQPFEDPDVLGVLSGCGTVIQECPSLFQPHDASTTDPSSTSTTASDVPVIRACEESCARFVTACSLESCPDSCAIERQVYGEACDAMGEAFYACAGTAGFDCAEEDLLLAVGGCATERSDYVTCFALGGVACEHVESYDDACVGADASHPYGKQCVNSAAPEDCVPTSSNFYCCATL